MQTMFWYVQPMIIPFRPSRNANFKTLLSAPAESKREKGSLFAAEKRHFGNTKATQLEGRTYACLDMPPFDPQEIYSTGYSLHL